MTLILQVTPNDVFLAYGPLGASVLILGSFSWWMIRRLVREIDELRTQRDGMVATLLEAVPLMRRSTEIHEKRQAADELMRNMIEEDVRTRREVVDVLRDVRRELERRP